MKSYHQLMGEVVAWARYNYGGPSHRWQLLLGMVEEAGEYSSATSRSEAIDALADGTIYALNLCHVSGVDPDRAFDPRYWGAPFPDSLSGSYMLRVFGKASHAVLKSSQGIRGVDEVRMNEQIAGFLRAWADWANREAYFHQVGLLATTNEVWEKVSKRDWKTNPLSGAEVQPPTAECHPGRHCTNWPNCESCGPARI